MTIERSFHRWPLTEEQVVVFGRNRNPVRHASERDRRKQDRLVAALELTHAVERRRAIDSVGKCGHGRGCIGWRPIADGQAVQVGARTEDHVEVTGASLEWPTRRGAAR